jgi:hypothetical protein
VDVPDRLAELELLREEFTSIRGEHDDLSQRPYDAEEHERHRARLPAFVEALNE